MAKLDDLLPVDTYCPLTIEESGGDSNCNHQYDEQHIKRFDTFAKAECIICGMIIMIEVWN